MDSYPRFSRLTLSRRDFLRVAGAGAAVPWIGWGPPSFKMMREGKRVCFWLNGKKAWIVDPNGFSGNARLEVIENPDRILMSLAHAVCPGTDLAADFECLLADNGLGWRMDFRMPAGESF